MTMLDDSRVYVRANRVTVRRRKVVLTLATLGAAVALAAVATGLGAFWLALFVVMVLGGLYGLLMRLADRRAVEKEFGRWESELGNFELFGNDVAPIRDGSGQFDVKAMPHKSGPGEKTSRVVVDTVRFVACNAAGWALAPLVFALTILVGRTPSDTTGQRWLANLRDTQEKLEEGSRRTVALAATTASVTVVSTAVVFGGATAANAAPVTTHASSPVAAASTWTSTGSANVVSPASGFANGSSGEIHAVLMSASTSTSYTVQAGDTLDSIATKFSTTYENLAAINHISDPNLIYPGQTLQLDGNPQAPQPTPAVTTTSSTQDAPGSYTVQAGDTLDSIATKFSTTYENLA
ncbi:MAG: LysM peptidoglycan-binding domain-containing protein, partial [Acidimicrobiales bacterium]